MIRYAPLPLLLLLAACATPQQQCVNDATRDVQVLDRLIIETRQNIDRGYAIEDEVVPRVGFNYCFGNTGYYGSGVGLSFCSGTSTSVQQRPVAIDLEAERQKLAELERTRSAAADEAQTALRACEAQFGA